MQAPPQDAALRAAIAAHDDLARHAHERVMHSSRRDADDELYDWQARIVDEEPGDGGPSPLQHDGVRLDAWAKFMNTGQLPLQ